MVRSISRSALLLASVSAILGSGWLFAAFYTSTYAGPAALLAWLIGGGAVIIIAFVFAELSAMLPIMGSSSRIPQYTHGTLVSFAFSWMIWLSYAALVPTEVQAVVQYISFYFPNFTHIANGELTTKGYLCATGLMILISAINVFSLRWLLRCNNFLTALKLVIPIVISLILILHFHDIRALVFPTNGSFSPLGAHGIFAAITSGGIVFAFNGFKQACELAGEAKEPSRALPFAIIGSVAICLAIYLLLQLAFFSSLNSDNLTEGWTHIHIRSDQSPFAGILHQSHLSQLLPFLYIGAIVGPLAAGLMYASSACRSLYGTSKNGYLPTGLQKLTIQGNPWVAICLNFIMGMLLFMPLPGWNNMITFLTSLMAITYGIAPICLLALREQIPHHNRPFQLPFPKIWASFAFYICTLLTYWSGWRIISKLAFAMLIGLIILFTYHFFTARGRQLKFHWRASIWIWPYFIGVTLISYLGNFGNGLGIIHFGWDFVALAALCLITIRLAMIFKLSPQQTQEYIHQLELNAHLKPPTTMK